MTIKTGKVSKVATKSNKRENKTQYSAWGEKTEAKLLVFVSLSH